MLQARNKQPGEHTKSHRQIKPKKVPRLFGSPPVWWSVNDGSAYQRDFKILLRGLCAGSVPVHRRRDTQREALPLALK